jgi:hypothetical protein
MLADEPLWWPSVVGFTLLIATSGALWLKRSPSPRAPESSSSMKIFLGRFFLCLVLAIPVGLFSALLYQPAFATLNGALSTSSSRTLYAIVQQREGVAYLTSPYWGGSYAAIIRRPEHLPKPGASTTVAKVTLRRGALGALWIQNIDFEYLK